MTLKWSWAQSTIANSMAYSILGAYMPTPEIMMNVQYCASTISYVVAMSW